MFGAREANESQCHFVVGWGGKGAPSCAPTVLPLTHSLTRTLICTCNSRAAQVAHCVLSAPAPNLQRERLPADSTVSFLLCSPPHESLLMSVPSGGGGAPSTDLTALMEEKQRLLRRLQAKQQASSSSSSSKTSAARTDATREAGFNVYISGANEERVAEQHRREKAAAVAAARNGQTQQKHAVLPLYNRSLRFAADSRTLLVPCAQKGLRRKLGTSL